MINTDITGGSAQSQLFDLLAVVANPTVFKSKLDELNEATATYKKFVEAVGPVDDILALREQAKSLRQSAQDYRNATLSQADTELQAARAQAQQILDAAKASSEAIHEAANQAKTEVVDLQTQLKTTLADARKAQEDAKLAQKAAEVQLATALQATADAESAKTEAEVLKASLVAKYEAFLKGL